METYPLERPILSVDVVIFAVKDAQLEVLLMKREEEPFPGIPALPGVAIRVDETLEIAAKRVLREKVQWPDNTQSDVYLEQLFAFDALYRDPRGRTVSVAYIGITRNHTEKPQRVLWEPVANISSGSLPFDHNLIINTGVTRLRGKLRYTNIARAFLAETFRIEELQEVYEAILGYSVNRTNFRSKLLKIRLIEQVRILNEAVGKKGGRPPHLYRFTHNLIEVVDRDFL